METDVSSEIGALDPQQNFFLVNMMEEDCRQILEAPLYPSHGLHGVLRYRRESQERRVSLQPQPSRDQPVWCEFCGMTAKPPLDPDHTEELKDFCCLQYKEMFEEVARERRFVLELCEERPRGTLTAGDLSIGFEEQLKLGAGEWDSEESRLQQMEMERFYREAQTRPSMSTDTSLFHTKTISFQLSGCDPVDERLNLAVKKESSEEEKPEVWEWNDPSGSEPAGFGLNHLQEGARFIQKFYSNGNKFLTGFSDGSAQVFYPSGNLAIIVLTNKKERVCVVRDNITSHCPVRALFQSSGRATCYHGNGRVWLNMDLWGGQSLDEAGARTRKWSWSDRAQTPTPLRPIFLSLNKSVGVRVLGRQYIFVSFLALGQQAKFSVGSCVKIKALNSPPHSPSLCKEELFLLACRVHLQLTLTRLRWCQRFPSSSRVHNIKPPPVLLSLAQRLLSLSHNVPMKDTERTFIQHCLQDCQ
ncbi:glutamate-rich protein 6 isoform X2 [Astyanax mexicanus]|uniref:glutamate-rich protein 6 isoform X2 n=2 Tax=Astyanax mexicanus TaxID=7994 RepID=UPI000BBDC27E|nr:glutamate-rich protein 6 isoform X2 [Astyanax mexicanus]